MIWAIGGLLALGTLGILILPFFRPQPDDSMAHIKRILGQARETRYFSYQKLRTALLEREIGIRDETTSKAQTDALRIETAEAMRYEESLTERIADLETDIRKDRVNMNNCLQDKQDAQMDH